MNLKVYHNPGKIIYRKIRNYIEYLDQLKESETYISCYKMVRYLNDNYNLTPSQYYNLIVYNDIDKKHYCKICGKELKLISIRYAYYETCSKSCSSSLVVKKLKSENRFIFDDPEFKKGNSSRAKLRLANYQNHPIKSVEVHARSRRTHLINKSKKHNGLGYLYLAECADKSLFKIGATIDISNRVKMDKLNGSVITNIHEITSGNMEIIADVEYRIKLHFNQRGEFFNIERFEEVMNYIKSII